VECHNTKDNSGANWILGKGEGSASGKKVATCWTCGPIALGKNCKHRKMPQQIKWKCRRAQLSIGGNSRC
jgi:hypothetical protein